MTFSEKIIKLRKSKGLTQDAFASIVSVSRQAVYKWESGQSYPEAMKLVEIKKLFGISIDDLLDDSYDVVVPEKKKKRLSKSDRERIENEVKCEEGIEVAVEEPVAEPVVEDEPEKAETSAPEAAAEEPAPAPEEKKEEEPKKPGFFARLFGWK